MNKPVNRLFLGALAVALVTLFGTTSAQEAEKKTDKPEKAEVSALKFEAVGGGCGSEGPFCCYHHQSSCQKALENVDGVTKVVMNHEDQKVDIEYEKGKLNMNKLAEAAEEAGHELIFQ